jgi:universal stress protein E
MAVVTDPFARRQLAAQRAAALARRCGARVIFFNAFMIPQPVSDVPMGSTKLIIESAIRQREERLAAIAAKAGLSGDVQCVVRWDYPLHEAILREVDRRKPDLLIAESHRRGRFARLVLANTDWQLIRDCPCPLWFVRSTDLPAQPKWLVAVDPRHAKPAKLDDRLVGTAVWASKKLGGTVSLVHAYESPLSGGAGMLMEPIRLPISAERGRKFIETTTRSVHALARAHGLSAADCIVREGDATDVIAEEAARWRADVLVMGAVSRSLLARPVIGATAERVIDHVDCDVFIVKPAGFKAPVEKQIPVGPRVRLGKRDGRPGARRSATTS